ncbi:hypothetical protein RUND412_001109 [Rhizina undulata]
MQNFYQDVEMTPELDRNALLAAYKLASTEGGQESDRLFIFNYEGTLTTIVNDHEISVPGEKLLMNIKKLAQEKNNQVYIVSGRDKKFLEKWLGQIKEVGLSAEHGGFLKKPGSDKWENYAEKLDMSWQMDALRVFEKYQETMKGAFLERKEFTITWHFHQADHENNAFRIAALGCTEELRRVMKDLGHDVKVVPERLSIVVRHQLVHKGQVAKRILMDHPEGSTGYLGFVFCAGDGVSDEYMFEALEGGNIPPEELFTVSVGHSSKVIETEAKYHLPAPADLVDVIALLVGAEEAVNGGAVDVALEAEK